MKLADPDEWRCFTEASTSALVDYLTFANRARNPPPAKLRGRLVRHGSEFTVHDPHPRDLLALAPFELIRAEVSIDLKPAMRVPDRDRHLHLEAIHRYIAARIWPFEFEGVARSYRVSPCKGVAYTPRSLDDLGDATDPRLPYVTETEYVGHRSSFSTGTSNCRNWAQVRLYRKRKDGGQELPERDRRIRIEVTIEQEGLVSLGVNSAGDLRDFAFRPKLSRCFRLLQLDAAYPVTPPVHKRRSRRKSSSSPAITAIVAAAKAARRAIVRELVRDGGLLSVMRDASIQINTARRDVDANRKLGIALDNLSRRYSSRAHV